MAGLADFTPAKVGGGGGRVQVVLHTDEGEVVCFPYGEEEAPEVRGSRVSRPSSVLMNHFSRINISLNSKKC